MTADASYVYWVNQGDFAVRRVAKSGGPIVTLATMARQVAVIGESGSFLFCGETAASATAVSVVRIPKVGGPPTSIAATGRVSSLVVDANMVCWADRDAGMVLAVAFTGGTICPMASGLSNPGALTHDASYVYFGEQVSGGRIGRALKYLGPWNALAWNNCWPTAMAFDASGLYFSEPPCGRISEVALTGGMAMAVASGLSNAESVAIGGSNLYWADRATGEVAKGLLTGGPVTVLANGLLDPIQIVLDASYVYVAERGAGRILRLNR